MGTSPRRRPAGALTADLPGGANMILRPSVTAFVFSSFVMSVLTAAYAPPAFSLTNDQAKCVNGINKAGAKVAATQGKENSTCVKDAASGNTDACVVADSKDKVSGAEAKTVDAQAKCMGSPPFGFTSANAANTAAITEELALLSGIYGSPVHGAMLTDHDGATCQASVTKAYEKLASTRLKSFNGCKKEGIKFGGTINSATGLQVCMSGAQAADPKLKVAGALTKLGDTVTGKCANTALATAFPGCSASAGSAATLTSCP